MSINGKLQDGSMEIDAGNNLETFKMGSGAEEAIEVNDFQNVSIVHAFRVWPGSLGAFLIQGEASLIHIPSVTISPGRFSLRKDCSLFLIFQNEKKNTLWHWKEQFLELYEVSVETHTRTISFQAVIHNTVNKVLTLSESGKLFFWNYRDEGDFNDLIIKYRYGLSSAFLNFVVFPFNLEN